MESFSETTQNTYPELFIESKLNLFKRSQLNRFMGQLQCPEDGVTGFLMQVPEGIYNKVMSARFKSLIEDLGVSYSYLSALPDNIQIGAIILIDSKKITRPTTSDFVTVYGIERKDIRYTLKAQERFVMAEKIEVAEFPSNYSAPIFPAGEIRKLISEAVDASASVLSMMEAQILGSPPMTQSMHRSGTFTTIYPAGGRGISLAGSQHEFLINLFEDLHYPFCIDKNFNKLQKVTSWNSKKKVEIKTPATDFMFIAGNRDLAGQVLTNRSKTNAVVDGVVIESDPFVEGIFNTKTEIPLTLDYIDVDFRDFRDYLPEIRASIAHLKLQGVSDRVKEVDRIKSFDVNVLDLIKNETGEDLLIDYYSKPNMILDANIHFGRFENVARFASALDKGRSGISDKKGLKNSTKLVAQNIADLISVVNGFGDIRTKLMNRAKIELMSSAHEAELPLLKAFKNAVGSYGPIVPEETITEELAKLLKITFDDVIPRVRRELLTAIEQGMIREVNPKRYSWTQWFENNLRR